MSAHSVYLKEIKGRGVKYIKVVSDLDVGLNIVEGDQLKRALVVGENVYMKVNCSTSSMFGRRV